ncbi:MAG: GIY-YIG nuclease family protein [Methylococcales bacterium]
MFWVYILRCSDGSDYTGHTDNLERRMGQYQAGECAGYIAARLPIRTCLVARDRNSRRSVVG